MNVFLFCFNYKAQIQSQVDTCRLFTKKTAALPATEDFRVLQWRRRHQVSRNVEPSSSFLTEKISLQVPENAFRNLLFRVFSLLFLDYATWRSGRSQVNTSANMPLTNKSTPGLLPRPPLQTIHGRTDWSAKYGHRQWPRRRSDLCPKNCFSPKSRRSRFLIKMCT